MTLVGDDTRRDYLPLGPTVRGPQDLVVAPSIRLSLQAQPPYTRADLESVAALMCAMADQLARKMGGSGLVPSYDEVDTRKVIVTLTAEDPRCPAERLEYIRLLLEMPKKLYGLTDE